MSKRASKSMDSTVRLETEGNVTRIFFREKHQTPRDLELAQPDRRDMSVVPLECYEQVKALIDFFQGQGNYREVCLLTFGFCTGLRISDLLRLKVSDIIRSRIPMTFRTEIDIREQKTGKRTVNRLDSVLITEAMQLAFAQYFATKDDTAMDRYLFTTQRSAGKKPMSIRMIQLSLAPAFAAVCPNLHCSTHTMRKTFVSGTMKSGMLSLRRAVSDFVMGRTKIRNLKTEYTAILYQISPSIEEAAISLGCPPIQTFFRITAIIMLPGVFSGAILSWVTILNELSASIILYTVIDSLEQLSARVDSGFD